MLKLKRLIKSLQQRPLMFVLTIVIATIFSASAFPLSNSFATTYSPVADEQSCLALSELGATVRWDEGSFGNGNCVVTGGTLEIGTDDTINIDVGARWLFIQSSAEVVNYGHIAVTGGHLIFSGSNFENHGTVDATNGGLIEMVDSASVNNYGEIDLSNSGAVSIYAGSTGFNQGTIEINSGSQLNLGSQDDTSDSTFTNSGIVNLNEGGTLRLQVGTFTNTCEGTLNNNGGTIDTTLGTIIDGCSPIQLIDKLTNYVNDLNYLKNKNSLLNPLKDARSLLSDSNTHNDKGACGDMNNFVSTVKDLQKSGKLKSEDASTMMQQANQIMTVLKC